MYVCMCIYIYIYMLLGLLVNYIAVIYTRLVSNSAPTWSSRCCVTACHF